MKRIPIRAGARALQAMAPLAPLAAAWLAAVALPAPLAARQEPSTIAALLAEAEASNPEILAARKRAEAADARVPQAGALPDPNLTLGLYNYPFTDPSISRDPMSMATVQLGERFPWPGKLGLREEEARLYADAAEWDVERARRSVAAGVKAAYYELYFLDRALEVTSRNEALLGDLAAITSVRYAVGDGAQPDVLRAQVERTRLADQVVALAQRRASAEARLNALLARPTGTRVLRAEVAPAVLDALAEGGRATFASASLIGAIGGGGPPAPGIPPVEELQRLALERNPRVRAHVLRIEGQERALALAGKAKLPDVSVTVAYSRRADRDDFANLVVSIPLPVFAGRKQNQAVVEEAATLAEQRALHGTMVDAIDADIASLAAELRRARAQLVLLNGGILPQARTALESATASYRTGRVDFLALLDAQVILYGHELDYHRLLADFATNVARLEEVVGTEVLP